MNALDPRLKDEIAIRWLRPTGGMRYVRESLMLSRSRCGPIKIADGHVLGFAELQPTAKGFNRYFFRRVFWLKRDSDIYPGCCTPCEAVSPTTIQPRISGRLIHTPGPSASSPHTNAPTNAGTAGRMESK